MEDEIDGLEATPLSAQIVSQPAVHEQGSPTKDAHGLSIPTLMEDPQPSVEL